MSQPNRTVLSVFGVEPRRIGGAEMYARELSIQLAEHGWSSVLCFGSEPPEQVRRYLALPNVTLETVKNSWQNGSQPTRDLAGVLRRHRPAILHMSFTAFLSPFPWLAKVYGVRQVFFTDQGSHAADYQPKRSPLLKRTLARAITWPLTRVLCVSDYNARCMTIRDFVPRQRVSRLYNATDVTRPCGDGAVFRRKYGIPQERAVVLQTSWIRPEKGIDDVIDAARIVLRKIPAIQFVLVGEGPDRPRYMEGARQAGIADHVTWTGLVDDPLADGVYAAADIVCQASRWQEAFGWVIAEGMACCKPVVATRVGGIPEVVQDGVTGFLVPHANPQALADKLLVLLADPGLRQRMGCAGRAAVETRFNLKRTTAELISLYGIA
jgi:glycosyltransferase involved in cell wall biosynthesis